MRKREIRFSIAIRERQCRAASWIVCTNSNTNDVYIACRELNNAIKVSLHESNEWRFAYDFDFYANKVAQGAPRNKDRIIDEWQKGTSITDGLTLALRIVTPHSAINMTDGKFSELTLIDPTPGFEATEVGVFITDSHVLTSNWPGRNSMNSQLIGKYDLPNKSTVYIVSWGCGVPDVSSLPNNFKYFNGVTKADVSNSLRALIYGDHADGSKVLYDLLASKA